MSTNRTEDIERIGQKPGVGRFKYFLKTVVSTEEVYGLLDDEGWGLLSDESLGDLIPLFPDADFAERFRQAAQWEDSYHPEAIDLQELMHWLDDMERDGLLLAIFPNEAFESVVYQPARLKTELLSIFDKEKE
jgi:hypothetical protein